MRKIGLTLLLSVLLLSTLGAAPGLQDDPLSDAEGDAGSVVCQPGQLFSNSEICLPLGPSGTILQQLSEGIPYPILPLPAYQPDSSYNDVPYQYFWINTNGTAFYTSLENAIANQPSGPHMYPSNHLLVSYTELVDTGSDSFYRLRSGYWIRSDGGRLARYNPAFQGLLFSSPPRNAFGWILGEVRPRLGPSLSQAETGTTHYRFEVVQFFNTAEQDGLTWYQISPDEWVTASNVARVDPQADPPEGVTGGRWIQVNLFEQTLTIYDNYRLVFATMASTGIDRFWTRPGLFQIYKKLETETMSNSIPDDFYYLEDVPWTMYFDQARALHGAYWHNWFGYPQSHGCVNLSLGDAHWIYDWASVGDYVYVFDPSGNTPTDPALFGSGGY